MRQTITNRRGIYVSVAEDRREDALRHVVKWHILYDLARDFGDRYQSQIVGVGYPELFSHLCEL